MEYSYEAKNYTINIEPKLIFKNWTGFENYPIEATFDFSKIPKELHQSFFNMIANQYYGSTFKQVKPQPSMLEKILFYKLF